MKRLSVNGARRGVVAVLTGTALAQLISLVFLPLLTRVYSAEAFGALTVVTSTTMLVTTFSTLRLETALMLPKARNEVRALLNISFASTAVFACLAGLTVYILGRFWGIIEIGYGIPIWITISVLLTGVFTLLNRLALRKGGFREVGKRAVVQSLATSSSQLALSPVLTGPVGLLLGSVLGRLFGIMPLYIYGRSYIGRSHRIVRRRVARRYWRFPVIFAPSAAMNAFGVQAPLLFVAGWYGIAFGGVLGLADRIIGIPMGLLGNSVAQVFDSEMAKRIRANSRDFVRPYLKLSIALGAVAVVVGGGFFLLGRDLVPFALGTEWSLAGECVRVMSLTIALRLVASPVSRVIGLFQRAKLMVCLDVLRALLIATGFGWIVVAEASFLAGVSIIYGSLAFIYALTWIAALVVVWQESRQPIKD